MEEDDRKSRGQGDPLVAGGDAGKNALAVGAREVDKDDDGGRPACSTQDGSVEAEGGVSSPWLEAGTVPLNVLEYKFQEHH